MSEPKPALERPVEQTERASLLLIIDALAKLAKIDIARPSKAAAVIASQTALMGNRVGERTIEGHLKSIPKPERGRPKADVFRNCAGRLTPCAIA